MCWREQRSDDLRRAIRDVICDENYEEHAAPSRRLDFEIFCNGAGGERLLIFLVERKTFQDFFDSQRDHRLQSQLNTLEGATEYRGRLLIVEATDAEWQQDARPAEYQDFVGVRTLLNSLQLGYGELNESNCYCVIVIVVLVVIVVIVDVLSLIHI